MQRHTITEQSLTGEGKVTRQGSEHVFGTFDYRLTVAQIGMGTSSARGWITRLDGDPLPTTDVDAMFTLHLKDGRCADFHISDSDDTDEDIVGITVNDRRGIHDCETKS